MSQTGVSCVTRLIRVSGTEPIFTLAGNTGNHFLWSRNSCLFFSIFVFTCYSKVMEKKKKNFLKPTEIETTMLILFHVRLFFLDYVLHGNRVLSFFSSSKGCQFSHCKQLCTLSVSIFLYVYMCVCVEYFKYLYLYVCVCICVCVCTCMHMHMCMHVCVCMC